MEEQINAGLNNCYNFEWEKAETIFKRVVDRNPEHPAGYHYLSSIYFWYYMSNKQQKDLDGFIKYSDLAIEKAKTALEKNRANNILYIIGSNYTYRAIAFAKDEEFLDAAWATKESESYLSEVVEQDPKYYDAYLGLGLYNFAISQIPAAFKWVLSLAGISGDQEKGLKYIILTAEKGKYSKTEAQYYLSQIYSEVIYDYKSSASILNRLLNDYPDNILFIYSSAVLEIKRRNLDKAESLLLKILSVRNVNFAQLVSFSNFLMGDLYFRKNEFGEAVNYYQKFLLNNPIKDYSGIAAYRLALCLELSGNRARALEFYAASAKGNQDLEDDIFAKEKGAVFFKKAITNFEKEVIIISNMVEAGLYTRAVEKCLTLITNLENPDQKGEVYLLLSEASYFLGEVEKSIKYADSALAQKIKENKWIKPYSYYYLARANMKMGKTEEAKYFAGEAEDYSGYFYETKLRNLLKSLFIKH